MVKSPCIGTCLYDPNTSLCLGCQRMPREITDWMKYTDEEKLKVLERIKNAQLLRTNKPKS